MSERPESLYLASSRNTTATRGIVPPVSSSAPPVPIPDADPKAARASATAPEAAAWLAHPEPPPPAASVLSLADQWALEPPWTGDGLACDDDSTDP